MATATKNEKKKMSAEEIAAAFKALGDPTRLRIFRFLQSCCCGVALDGGGGVRPVTDGPTVGEVCCRITGFEKVSSTISHHIKELRTAGLIEVERRGRNMICRVRPETVAGLQSFLAGGSPGAQPIRIQVIEKKEKGGA